MKILVTGSTGFVGSHLCERLTEEGHEVYALARSPKKFEEFKVPGKMVLGSLDERKDHEWIASLPEDLDAVIHTAGIVHSFDWSDFYSVNTRATEKLIEDLKKKYPTNLKFVLISSQAAAGPAGEDNKKKEHHDPRPVSHYGKSKRYAEISLNHLAPLSWDKTIIRPPMVIGPRDPAILEVFKMVKSGLVLVAGMNGMNNRYSFICVHDLVNVIVKATEHKSPESHAEVFFAAHTSTVSYSEIVGSIKEALGKKFVMNLSLPMFMVSFLAHFLDALRRIIPLSLPLTPDKIGEISQPAWVCCSEKSCEKLDYTYSWDLTKTVEETLKDYRQRQWL
jgi:nucleoside-diphosphate-sugar epimerase